MRTRRWVFKRQHGYWSINGKIWDPDRIDAAPREGDVEIWEFVNNGGGWIHPIHLHMTNFRILSRNGRAPRPWERELEGDRLPGRQRDAPGSSSSSPRSPCRAAYRARSRAGTPTTATSTEHEDHDMMLQFEVNARA